MASLTSLFAWERCQKQQVVSMRSPLIHSDMISWDEEAFPKSIGVFPDEGKDIRS